MTNEQSIIQLQDKANKLKDEYKVKLRRIIEKKQNNTLGINDILEVYEAGNKYFNFYEKFVGESELLGGHKREKWVISFAEDCFTILKNYIEHINFIRGWQKEFEGIEVKPSKCAMANLQRMVVEYLNKDLVKNLKEEFIKNSLPICGFSYKKSLKQHWKRLNLAGKIGVVGSFASMIGVILYFIPIGSETDNISIKNNSGVVIKNNYGIINNGNINNSNINIDNLIDNKILNKKTNTKHIQQIDANMKLSLLSIAKEINKQSISLKRKNKKCKVKAKFLHQQFNYDLEKLYNLCDEIFGEIKE